MSVVIVALAVLGLAALPAYPQTETASVRLEPVEIENARKLLGESPSGERADPSQGAGSGGGSGGGEMTMSIPKLELEDVRVPSADSQVALDREGIIHLDDTGAPWKEGSNTVIVGHALGFLFTETPYVFYELDQLEPGDEIYIQDRQENSYTFEVYDHMTVRPEDYWITYPLSDNRTVLSLQTCTPIPTFENRLVVRAELVS